ncbi:MAG TPA: hypothetical protein VIO58_09450 [Candidatus Methanoperedens sp.]
MQGATLSREKPAERRGSSLDRVEVNSTITPIGFKEDTRKVRIAEKVIKRHLVTVCEDSGIIAANRNRRKYPSPAMGYARRKPNTGNRSVRFDEEGMAEKPFLYSTTDDRNFMLVLVLGKQNNYFSSAKIGEQTFHDHFEYWRLSHLMNVVTVTFF